MSISSSSFRALARPVKGFRDSTASELRVLKDMMRIIEKTYEIYGFEPLEQPFLEYSDALGKFLPDQDRPNAGVFSFQDDDQQWVSLRYDLTAPLARYVAENYAKLPMPFRSYRQGFVFRNEKPGPGRFRQFMQFDADIIGATSLGSDAELCMMAVDAMAHLGLDRGSYIVKLNSRKILDGFQLAHNITPEQRLVWMRALDKFDRVGEAGVADLLGPGRRDPSGDFTKGAGLTDQQIAASLHFVCSTFLDRDMFKGNVLANEGADEIATIEKLCRDCGYGIDQLRYDPSVIRGLEYYTGAVFECELLHETCDEQGALTRFGAIGGGGRYDDLIARFTGQCVPATGFSIGVSRLQSALQIFNKMSRPTSLMPVLILVLDRDRISDYHIMAMELRHAGIRAEVYLGTSGMKAQMKYADRAGAPLVVIQGEEERLKGEVSLKDLVLGSQLNSATQAPDHALYKQARLAQISVPRTQLVENVKDLLAQHDI